MKRIIHTFVAAGIFFFFSTLASEAVVTLTAANGTAGDAAWTKLNWRIDDVQDGNVFAWDAPVNQSDPNDPNFIRDHDVNDVFRISVPNGLTGTLDVVDIAHDNDRYTVMDFGDSLNPIFSTGAYAGNNLGAYSAGSNEFSPSYTFADTDWSKGSYTFAPGTYDLKVAWVDTPADQTTPGSLYVRFTTVPEPSSTLLALLGLFLCGARRRR